MSVLKDLIFGFELTLAQRTTETTWMRRDPHLFFSLVSFLLSFIDTGRWMDGDCIVLCVAIINSLLSVSLIDPSAFDTN
jgi:hypothetical protein